MLYISMKNIDARSLPPIVQEALHKRAVLACAARAVAEKVAATLGVSSDDQVGRSYGLHDRPR